MRQRRTQGRVQRLSYSPSGRLLVGRGWANVVQVWDAQTLERRQRIGAGDPREKLLDCFFRPGGLRFLLEQGYVGAERDLPAGPPRPEHEEVLPGPESDAPGHWICFGPDGQSFVGWYPAGGSARAGLCPFGGRRTRVLAWL